MGGAIRSPKADAGCYWPRAILHVDMNAFFASIEQRDFPELHGRPVGITNGAAGTTLITCSYEARAHGVHTGMKIYEARRLCPEIVQRPARPQVYAAVSTRIMRALTDVSPDVEVFSVDEAFLDVTHCQRLHGNFFAMVAADPATVQWEGEDAVVRYTSSPDVQRSFCRHCGSRIGKHPEGNPRVLLSAGLFGPETGLTLRKNVWAASKPDWYALPPESTPKA